jgi:two-component system OmpR family response regulator
MARLLLVDDDRDCLTALSNRLRFALRGQGVDVDVADSAATGLISAHAAHYDVLIVDVLMPGINGFKFVEQLRRTQPHVPIIMVSGWDVKSCEEQTARLGLSACLSKPIDFSRLRELLHEVLDDDQQGHSIQRVVRHPPHPPWSLQPHRSHHR